MTLRKLGMKRIRSRRLGDRFSTGIGLGKKKTGGMATRGGQILTQTGGMTHGALLHLGGDVAQFAGDTIKSMKSTLEK